MIAFILSAVIGYVLGSIPFGLILTKLGGYGDIRSIGSGNIGATNVLRTGNKKLAIATLLLDALKGAIAIIVTHFIFPTGIFIAGFFALLGHIFPVWLKFKGGKGVATGLGILLTLSWPTGLAAAGTWLFMAFTFRYSSLSALVAVALSPLFAFLFTHNTQITILCAMMGAIIIAKHHSNIKRLLRGEEPKIGKKKTE